MLEILIFLEWIICSITDKLIYLIVCYLPSNKLFDKLELILRSIESSMTWARWFFDYREIKVGDYYSDCGHIPRRCIKADPWDVIGCSLLDDSVGGCSVYYCAPDKITKEEALQIKEHGPIDPNDRAYLKSFYASEWGAGRSIWWKE